MTRIRFTVSIWEENGVYVSKCHEVEVAGCGDSPWSALDNLRDAIDLYLINALELGIIGDLEPALTSVIGEGSLIRMTICNLG